MSDKLDSIQSDTVLDMTEGYKRAFIIAGCNPTCHCCFKTIKVGDKFKLAYIVAFRKTKNPHLSHEVGGKDEMLCQSCTPAKLIKKRLKANNKHEKDLKNPEYQHSIANVGYTREHKRN